MTLAPPKRPTPKPWSEMSDAERADYQLELEADELLDECQGVPPLELARGLLTNTEEFGAAHSQALAHCIQRRDIRRKIAERHGTQPSPPEAAPIKSRPVRQGKGAESLKLF